MKAPRERWLRRPALELRWRGVGAAGAVAQTGRAARKGHGRACAGPGQECAEADHLAVHTSEVEIES